jgi:hypothetical protein
MSSMLSPTENRLLRAILAADETNLKSHLSPAYFERDKVLSDVGQNCEHVYFPTTAVLSVISHMETGQMVESSAIGRETGHCLLHALCSGPSVNRVVVQMAGHGFQVASLRLREAAFAAPPVMEAILRHVRALLIQSEQSVACNALHHVEARLCRWLLMCHDRVNDRALPLTQEFLSHMLGVQRTTVTAAASALQAAGMIRYSRGVIEILDRPALEAGACECYSVVQQKLELALGQR